MSFFGTVQLPPTAWMIGEEMNSARLSLLTPPVGINFVPGKGPERDFSAFRPPYTLAGKNFSTFRSCFFAIMISVGVTQPGVTALPDVPDVVPAT